MSHGYVFILLCYTNRDDWCNVRMYLHIGVRLRVARFDGQAMREPNTVKRATGTGSHAFLIYKGIYKPPNPENL